MKVKAAICVEPQKPLVVEQIDLDGPRGTHAFGHCGEARDVRKKYGRLPLHRRECSASGDHGVDDCPRYETPEHVGQSRVIPLRLQLPLERATRPPHHDRNEERHHD